MRQTKGSFLKMQISPCHCVGNFLWLSTHFKLTLPCFQVSLKSWLAHLGDLTSRRHTSSGSVLLNLARGYFVIGGFPVFEIVLWSLCCFSPSISVFPQRSTGLAPASTPLPAKFDFRKPFFGYSSLVISGILQYTINFHFSLSKFSG